MSSLPLIVVMRRAAPGRPALKRDYAVGWRVHGASNRIADLCNLNEELLREFAWDIDQGVRSRELALFGWAGAEEDTALRARELAAQIESGVTYSGRESDELLDIPPTMDQGPLITNLLDMMRGADGGSEKGAKWWLSRASGVVLRGGCGR